jgi:hypothetical protein
LSGEGTEVAQSPLDAHTYWLKINDLQAPLALFPDPYHYVNSKRLLQSLVAYVSGLPHHQQAELAPSEQWIMD